MWMIKEDARTAAICFACFGTLLLATTGEGETAHRVNASVLAERSSVHTSIANRDAYLLRVTPRSGTAFDAIAIDSYPGYAEALPLHDMTKDARFSVRLIRTPYCDRPDNEGEVVRCFAIERKGLKILQGNAADQWWK
jgi:hypothetical protein